METNTYRLTEEEVEALRELTGEDEYIADMSVRVFMDRLESCNNGDGSTWDRFIVLLESLGIDLSEHRREAEEALALYREDRARDYAYRTGRL